MGGGGGRGLGGPLKTFQRDRSKEIHLCAFKGTASIKMREIDPSRDRD